MMKKMMVTMSIVAAIVGAGLFAVAEHPEKKAKAVAEMTVDELKDQLAKDEAALAAEKNAAKKAALQKQIDEIKKLLEPKAE
jgi:outer membrane murein-binding lipoprotein Lpp